MHLCRKYNFDQAASEERAIGGIEKLKVGCPAGNSTIGARLCCRSDHTMIPPHANTVRRHPLAWSLAAALVLALAWGALAPLRYPTRDQLFDIPEGTAARLAAGATDDVLPREVRLTLGVQDVLLLRNSDSTAQLFGPVRIMPGEEFRMPFEQASDFQVASTAHAGGRLTVSVVALPDPGWNRLCWRLAALRHAIRYLKQERPLR
jgi:hypothetical protein